MIDNHTRSAPVESADLVEPPSSTEVLGSVDRGVSPENIPDPDYTTYEDFEGAITAPVRLPPRDAITVQLGPINLVDRLEEYQSDENLGHTLIGLFFGAALGIIVNWVTAPSSPSGISGVLLGFLIMIAIGAGIWLRRVKRRKQEVKSEIESLSR